MPICKTKALVSSWLLLICMPCAAGQLHPKDCAGAPVYTNESLAPDKADLEVNLSPSCQRIPHYLNQMIFTGTVTRVVKSEGRALLNGDCSYTELQTVTVAVKEVFAGHPPQTFTFHAGDINGAYFDEKRTYLIIGHQKPDGSFIANSLVTKPIADAKDDLAYLRSLPQRPASAEIFGSAFAVYAPPHDLMIPAPNSETSSLPISIGGPANAQTKTDRTGEYKLTGLPAGRYTIRLDTDKPMESARIQTVDVAPRGCAQINFYIVEPFPAIKPEKKH